MNYPIRLETPRLYTRPLTMEDQFGWKRFMESAAATRFFPPTAESPQDRARTWIEKQLGRYENGKYGLMALMHRETGTWIGQCGLLAQHVDGADELEVGYHIFPDYWLQGYASEAAQAFRNWGFEQDLAPSIISIIHQENIGSQGVALRNGMTREKPAKFWDMDVYVYRIWRDEWRKLGRS
jgi:[ribosomal protein S5]-alanine N-acetyltransferase